MKLTTRHPDGAMAPILDRLIEFDERSRSFPVRALLPAAPKLRSYTWRCLDNLNQMSEGACVGFAWTHELAARPSEVKFLHAADALQVYHLAQTLDPWQGESYSGTSVLAGVKAVQQLHPGKISSYRWAFGLNDVLATLSYLGPVVLGISWHSSMFRPDASGLVTLNGDVAGGHAILANGINLRTRQVRLHNSWGSNWGKNGECFISFEDLDKLLKDQGEACVAVGRMAETRRK